MKQIWKYKISNKIVNIILMMVIPIGTLCCVEFYSHVPWDLSVSIFLLNLLFYYLIYMLFTFIAGRASVGYVLGTIFFAVIGLANYCVVDFRSSPIVPWDLYSIGTAASVAGNYSLDITPNLIKVILGFVLLALLGSRMGIRVNRRRIRLAVAAVFMMCICLYVKEIGTDAVIKAAGLDTTLFTPNVLYRNNGLISGFLGNMKYLKVSKPDGYSTKKVEEMSEKYRTEEQPEKSKFPNIIVVMDEAFSDLSVFGDFNTDQEQLPFINSLKENTIKGKCYVSVKGGNTANSEYEFLTGDSMAFMPAGSIPYQQYLKREMPSLASRLKQLGYSTTAIHPYNSTGWCRNTVYPMLGFDRMIFKDQFQNAETVRDFVSDRAAYSKIAELYQQKEKESPMFVFEVTMQNHGGYSKDKGGFVADVHLTDLEDKSIKVRAAETYLSLMNETDRAFQELVEYFKEQEEDTIILLFGDHQPSDYITDTFLKLQGLNRETSQDVEFDNYIVPYVMWANFDIKADSSEYGETSLNYLGGMLMEQAGIGLTGYQQFLKELQESFPAITSRMLLDKDGKRSAIEDADQALIKQYNEFVYNHLCDKEKPENFY